MSDWKRREAKFCSRRCYLRTRRVSSVELAVRHALRRAKVRFETQYPVGKWHADLYVPKARAIIEVDGVYWHALPGAAERDRKIDAWAQAHGLAIIRLPEQAIRHGAERCLDALWPEWRSFAARGAA